MIARGLELAAPERLQDMTEQPRPDPLPKVNGRQYGPDCPHCDSGHEEG